MANEKRKYLQTKDVAAFVLAARKHNVKPSWAAFEEKFGPSVRQGAAIAQWRLLEALGEVMPRTEADRGTASQETQRKRTLKQVSKLREKLDKLMAELGR